MVSGFQISRAGRAQRRVARVLGRVCLIALTACGAAVAAPPAQAQDEPVADMKLVSLADAPDPVEAGQNVTYTIDTSNLGPATANGATLEFLVPAGTTIVSADPSDGSCDISALPVVCSFGDVAADAEPTVTIVVEAPAASGELVASATVSALNDGDSANNVATASTQPVADTEPEDGASYPGSGSPGGPSASAGGSSPAGNSGGSGADEGGKLPMTGLGLGILVSVGAALAATGFGLRRLTAKPETAS